MTPQEESNLAKLFETFYTTSLGEGNSCAGANLLVTMAVTLANVSRQGSNIKSPAAGRMRVGTSLLVSGSLTAGLVRDNVLIDAAMLQSNLLAHITQLTINNSTRAARAARSEFDVRRRSEEPTIDDKLLHATHPLTLVQPDQATLLLHEALNTQQDLGIDVLSLFPKFLVTAKNPQNLNSQLTALHNCRPLIALGLLSPDDAEDYEALCAPLLNGLFPMGKYGNTIRANLLVSDPGDQLATIVEKNCPHTAWLNQMVWLVDRVSGPSFSSKDEFHIGKMVEAFRHTLSKVLSTRLNIATTMPASHEIELAKNQVTWVDFLTEMEGRLPGISGSARGLLATLVFGLTELSLVYWNDKSKVVLDEVEALAKWVVLRMANAREEMTGNANHGKLRMHAERIVEMLTLKGSLATRDIYRYRSLEADKCRALLLAMEKAGLLVHEGDQWKCSTNSKIEEYDYNNLCIEV
jgi:hypothetical protein